MAYRFTGLFSRALQIDHDALAQGHVFRTVADPFEGGGILAPDLTPDFDACLSYLDRLGIAQDDWVFFDYQTWAGPIEHVRTLGIRGGVRFGPIEAAGDAATEAFLSALEAFGLGKRTVTYFAPFERGYWGDV